MKANRRAGDPAAAVITSSKLIGAETTPATPGTQAPEPWLRWRSNGPSIPCPRCKRPMERRTRERPPAWFRGIWYVAWDHCPVCPHQVFHSDDERCQ